MSDGSIDGIVGNWRGDFVRLEAAGRGTAEIATLHALLDGFVAADLDLEQWLYPPPTRDEDVPLRSDPLTQDEIARLQARRRRVLQKVTSAERELEFQRARFMLLVAEDPSPTRSIELGSVVAAVSDQLGRYRKFIQEEQRVASIEDKEHA